MPQQRIQISKRIRRRGGGDDTPIDGINTGEAERARQTSSNAARAIAEINRLIGR